jgi:predicted ferric reductase
MVPPRTSGGCKVRHIRYALVGILLVLTLLWVSADGVLWTEYEFFGWRTSFINYTGIIGMGAMSAAMLLALRPVRLEPFLGRQ